MEINERLKDYFKEKKWTALMIICGAAGLFLIALSSLVPEKEAAQSRNTDRNENSFSVKDYCRETEQRLEDFLEGIEGAGQVKVYITVGSGERSVYAREERKIRSDNKTEEEEKYVVIGNGSDKKALVETTELPAVRGAVIICSGGDSAEVRERMYKATAAALDLPTGKIYVAKLDKGVRP
ncbi:MAG: hypothetical protein IKH78_03220 [Ruminococcus sp.]|nr:hypothetical protein [Ruminococcus sp.]